MRLKILQNVFSTVECDQLVEKYASAVTAYKYAKNKQIKSVVITDEWFITKMTKLVNDLNDRFYQFDIEGIFRDPVFIRYDEDSFFGWHNDMYCPHPCHKFTVIVILSEPSDYEGGELEYFDYGVKSTGRLTKGSVVVFPSWLNHQITAISKGVRYSSATFVGGPKFR